jgi:hypothetical protein
MIHSGNNYAFIDSQNIHLGIRGLGWKLDWLKFRIYLAEKYHVTTAYLFLGFLLEYTDRYVELQKAGFILQFKPVVADSSGEIKGNIDADMVLHVMIDFGEYEKAIIVTSDGDFYSLVDYLYKNNRLQVVLSPCADNCSALLKKAAKGKIAFINDVRKKLDSFNDNEKAPQQDKT